jgi:hypothetical protein
MTSNLHPPALPGVPSIDESYAWLIEGLPARLAETARTLPARLGLTQAKEGGWGDFIGLHPNRDLPLYAAQDAEVAGGLSLPLPELHRFVRAHHVGGFAWLLRDRLADGQIAADDQLMELARRYTEGWRDTLAEATGDATLTEALVTGATARWRRGTAAEQNSPGRGSLTPAAYTAIVRDKLAWIGAPSHALLMSRGGADRLRAFRDAHDLFLIGLQAVDDVVDRDDDRARRGSDIPTWLGCTPGALLRVAPKLVTRAGARAAAGGFSWIAGWLEAFGLAIAGWRVEGDPVQDDIEAIGLAGEIEEAVVFEDALPPGHSRRTAARA